MAYMVIVICPFIGYWDSVLFLHMIFLRKNEALLEMIQCLQTNNEQLDDRFNTIKNQKVSEKILLKMITLI